MKHKLNISFSIDQDLHRSASEHAAEKKISFSRLVHEALCAVLGFEGKFDPELRARVEERILTHPGRKALTPDEIERRQKERERILAERATKRLEAKLAKIKAGMPALQPYDDPRDTKPEE